MDFRILGLLEVVDGERPVELRAAKVRGLLAMLLINPRHVVPADRLAAALWSDAPPPSAVNTLQGYVSQLRRALGAQVVLTRSGGYLLAVDPERVDSGRFERLVAEGRSLLAAGAPAQASAVLVEALALWRGPALADFAFETFAQAETARLEELRLVTIEEHADAELALGNHERLVARLQPLVDAHPLRERLWRQLILALYRAGRQAEALRAFGALRRHLRVELHTEPSAALQALEEAVLMQRPELEWRPIVASDTRRQVTSTNLPHPRSTFVPRPREMAELDKLLGIGGAVTVVGPGGAGKSRLAVEVARAALNRFPGGVWLVDLAAVTDRAMVLPAVASVLCIDERPATSLIAEVAGQLSEGASLLILDTCDHLVGAAAEVAAGLLAADPELTVMATSRQPLSIEGETVWRIPLLALPPDGPVPTDAYGACDAVQLFADRASSSGFTVTADNVWAVAELCRRLDGLPLAIELAAGRARALTPGQLLQRLDDRLELLTTGGRAVGRHHSLRASLEWTYRLLTPRDGVLFRRLAAVEAEFDLAAAETLGWGDGLDREEVASGLAALVDRSVVLATRSTHGIRYRLPESHRAYAAELLTEAGESGTSAVRR